MVLEMCISLHFISRVLDRQDALHMSTSRLKLFRSPPPAHPCLGVVSTATDHRLASILTPTGSHSRASLLLSSLVLMIL